MKPIFLGLMAIKFIKFKESLLDWIYLSTYVLKNLTYPCLAIMIQSFFINYMCVILSRLSNMVIDVQFRG